MYGNYNYRNRVSIPGTEDIFIFAEESRAALAVTETRI
jgi:hypothetical protein